MVITPIQAADEEYLVVFGYEDSVTLVTNVDPVLAPVTKSFDPILVPGNYTVSGKYLSYFLLVNSILVASNYQGCRVRVRVRIVGIPRI